MRRRARPGGGRQVEIEIATLGGRGDGVADDDGRPLFIAGALPGDRVRARVTGERSGGRKGEVLELLAAGPGRVEPPCRHFGSCGGCQLQHLADDRYAAWKRELLIKALARCGLPGDRVAPLLRVAPGSRRRASVAARFDGEAVTLGFRGRDSHKVIDVPGCLLLSARLMAGLGHLRTGLGAVLPRGEGCELALLESESGLDVLIALERPPDLARREALAALAEAADLARLAWRAPGLEPEPLAVRRTPMLRFNGQAVTPPPGAFTQPTLDGERRLQDLVLAGLPEDAEAVVELFAGVGTFSFHLAERAKLHAVEGDGAACQALDSAARQAEVHTTVERRDLERRPLEPEELAPYDTLVFDPPRAGAKAQAERIAQSKLDTVIAISCNPNSFARDTRILVDSGFRLELVTPLDQFPWSHHLELVAQFRRPARKRSGSLQL